MEKNFQTFFNFSKLFQTFGNCPKFSKKSLEKNGNLPYNYSPHSTTKIAPNKGNKENEIQVLMNISKRAKKKKGNYPKLAIGDNVRVPVFKKVKKGYKDSSSIETHKVEEVNRGLHTVDGSLHSRKDLQLVKGNVIKAPTKTKAQQTPSLNKSNILSI